MAASTFVFIVCSLALHQLESARGDLADLPIRSSMIASGARPLPRRSATPFEQQTTDFDQEPDTTLDTVTPSSPPTDTDYERTTKPMTTSTSTPTPTTTAIDTRNSTLVSGFFRECCQREKLPRGCVDQCTFSSVDDNGRPRSMNLASCPPKYLHQVMKCMSNNRDNTECCASKAAFRQPKFLLDLCLPFCNPRLSQFPRTLGELARMSPCVKVGPEIGLCHMLNYF